MTPTENPLFVQIASNDMVNFAELAKELGFESIFINNYDYDIEEDGDKLINDWNPGEIVGFNFALKFWDHDDGMTAMFVKPLTNSAKLLWETGKNLEVK